MEDLKEKETSSEPEIDFYHDSTLRRGRLTIIIEFNGKLFHNELPNNVSIKFNEINGKNHYSLINNYYNKEVLIANNCINIFNYYDINDVCFKSAYYLLNEVKGILYYPHQMLHNGITTELKLIGYESIENHHSPKRHSSQIYGEWPRRVSNPGIGSDIKLYHEKRWKQYFPESCYIELDDIEKGNIPGFTEYKPSDFSEEEREKADDAITNHITDFSEENKKAKVELIDYLSKSSNFDKEDIKITDDIIGDLTDPESNNEASINYEVPKGIPIPMETRKIDIDQEEEDSEINKDNIHINNFIPDQYPTFEPDNENYISIGNYEGFPSIKINSINSYISNEIKLTAFAFRNAVIKSIKLLNITNKNIFISCNISGYKKIIDTDEYKIIDIYTTIIFDTSLNLVDYQMISIDKSIDLKLENCFKLKILI